MPAKLNRNAIGSFVFAVLGALSLGATASAQEAFELNSYRIELNDCPGCASPAMYTEEEVIDYLAEMRQVLADGDDDGNAYGKFKRDGDDGSPQVVYVDFDAGGVPTFPVCFQDRTLFGIFDDHVYTEAEREAILDRIRADYDEFNYHITDKEPTEGEYTTLLVGLNDAPEDCSEGSNITVFFSGGVSILFGAAEKIDFRNVDKSDNAFLDASFWEFLAQLDPSGETFEAFSGLDLDDFGGDLTAAVSEAVTNQSSNTGAHEIGHIQGLRHQNSFGPPGAGYPDFRGRISPTDFVPTYPGPGDATETVLHTMASGASVGLSLTGSTITDRFFSERSAIRIAFTEEGRSISEDRVRRNGRDKINLKELDVDNTIVEGINADADLKVKALTVDGEISTIGEIDSYTFQGKAGRMINVELISVIGRQLSFEDGIIGQVRLFQLNNDGTETLIAQNFQSFESVFDAEVFDALLPADATYRIEISAPDEFFPFAPPFTEFPFPLSAAGAPELQYGQYSAFIYSFMADFDDDDDDDEDDD